MDKHNSDKDRKNIRQANEELRKQIQDEYGGKTWINPDSNLPPELENEFLNHIMEFEKAFENRVTTTVYEFLDKPDYRKIEELSDDEISAELNRLYEIMEANQLQLNTICEVCDKELYRFITEELFFEEIDDIRFPGLMSNFIYEEFHPNQEHDIKSNLDMFVSFWLDKDSPTDFYTPNLSSKAKKQDWHTNFRDTFSSFEKIKFEVTEVEFSMEEGTGKVLFYCEINAYVENSNDVFLFKGQGKANIVYEEEYWDIETFELPNPVKIN